MNDKRGEGGGNTMIARMKETRNIQLSEFSTVQLARLLGGKYAETTGGQEGGGERDFLEGGTSRW